MISGKLLHRATSVESYYWLGISALLDIAFETIRLTLEIFSQINLSPVIVWFAENFEYFDVLLTGGFVFMTVRLIGPSLFTSANASTAKFRNQMGIFVAVMSGAMLLLKPEKVVLAIILLAGLGYLFALSSEGWTSFAFDTAIAIFLAFSFFSIDPFLTFLESMVLVAFLMRRRQISVRMRGLIEAVEERVLLLNQQAVSHPHGVVTGLLFYFIILLISQLFVISGAIGAITVIFGMDTIVGVLANLLLGRVGYPLIITSGVLFYISTLTVSLGMAIFWFSRIPRIAKYIEYYTNDQSKPGPIPSMQHEFPEFSTITYWPIVLLTSVGMWPVRSIMNATNVGGQILIPYFQNGQKQIGPMNPFEALTIILSSTVGIFALIYLINRKEPIITLENSVKGEHIRLLPPLLLTIVILFVSGFVLKTTLMYEVSIGLVGFMLLIASHYGLDYY